MVNNMLSGIITFGMTRKPCLFECNMGKYSTRPMNTMCTFRRAPYLFDICICIFIWYLYFNIARKINGVCIFSSSNDWHVTHDMTIFIPVGTTARVRYGLIPIWGIIAKTTAQMVRIYHLIRNHFIGLSRGDPQDGKSWMSPHVLFLRKICCFKMFFVNGIVLTELRTP